MSLTPARETLLLRITELAARRAVEGHAQVGPDLVLAMSVVLEHVPEASLIQIERDVRSRFDGFQDH